MSWIDNLRAQYLEEVADEEFHARMDAVEDEDRCPGCNCGPGDGRTPGCTHPEGCGYWETLHSEEQREIRMSLSTSYEGPEDHIVRSVN